MRFGRPGVKLSVLGLVAVLVGCGNISAGSVQPVVESQSSSVSAKPTRESLAAGPPTHPVNPPRPGPNGLPPLLNKIDTDERVVFLTFDDGAAADPRVAEILRKWDVPVTPFLTRNTVESNRAYYAEISAANGQVVQNHSVSHPQMPTLDEAGQQHQICATSKDFQDWFGQRPWMFRPPYGESNSVTPVAAEACGIDYLVNWSVSLPAAHLRYQVGDSLRPGDIILSHWRPDLHLHLPKALRDIRRQGFKVAALQDYLPHRSG